MYARPIFPSLTEEETLPIPEGRSSIATALAVYARDIDCLQPNVSVIQYIRRVLASERATAADVARAVEKDIRVSTALLRVVNSPLLGLGQRCSSVKHAVTVLGLRRVADVVAASSALVVLDQVSPAAPVICGHAIAVASVARYLAPVANVNPDEAFTAGLVHDAGLLVLLQRGEIRAEDWVDASGRLRERSAEEELEVADVDHAMLGGYAAARWEIPAPVPQVVTLHHDWEAAKTVGGSVLELVAVLQAAEALCPELERAEVLTMDRYADLIESPALEHLGLTFVELHNMWTGLRRAALRGQAIARSESPDTLADAPVSVALPPPPPRRSRAARALAACAITLAVASGAAGVGYAYHKAGAGHVVGPAIGAQAGEAPAR